MLNAFASNGESCAMSTSTLSHAPVMLEEVLTYLSPKASETFLDCTFGGGGYARVILRAAPCQLWAIDRDFLAMRRGYDLIKTFQRERGSSPLHMLNGPFSQMRRLCAEAGQTQFDGIVMDLGVSSYQIDDPSRGFSFKHNGPLDMRMGHQALSAYDLINEESAERLADIFYYYGEERHARRVAKNIVRERSHAPIETTEDLARVVRRSVPHNRATKIDPATRVFQGLRIAVNDELGELQTGLHEALSLLSPGGRLVVVSFHSLEDRIVKKTFKEASGQTPGFSRYRPLSPQDEKAADPDFTRLTRKIVTPQAQEIARNPRARSARLRALAKKPVKPSYSGGAP